MVTGNGVPGKRWRRYRDVLGARVASLGVVVFVVGLMGASMVAVATVAPVSPSRHAPSAPVFFPEGSHGVVCDRKADFCADAVGISMGLTSLYLGSAAQQRLLTVVGQLSADELSRYTLSNGVHCESKKRTCYVSKYSTLPDRVMTRQLFGH